MFNMTYSFAIWSNAIKTKYKLNIYNRYRYISSKYEIKIN